MDSQHKKLKRLYFLGYRHTDLLHIGVEEDGGTQTGLKVDYPGYLDLHCPCRWDPECRAWK